MKMRYALLPQMKDYDQLGQQWSPYLMFFHKPHYHSDVLNTDAYGFRMTHHDHGRLKHFENSLKLPVGLVVGGSFVFGVGATTDRQTIPSLLNENAPDQTWLNFGGRAFSSTQELLLFQFFHQQIQGIQKIIIISGINNLVLHYMSQHSHSIGSFFYQQQFFTKMNGALSKKRQLAKIILYPFFGDSIDYAHVPFKDLIEHVLYIKKIQSHGNSTKQNPANNFGKEHILQILNRDIVNWTLLTKALGIELYYVLQPFSTWIEKEKSEEENKLFAELDNFQGKDWKILKEKLDIQSYDWFTTELNNICHLNGIHFLDLNRELSRLHLDRKWLFVDRVHCTDEGNRIITNILKEKLLCTTN